MKYIRMSFFFIISSLLFFSFQNFRTIQPKISAEFIGETASYDPSACEKVIHFYKNQYTIKKTSKLYNGPKDYLKKKIEKTPLYLEGEEWIEDVIDGESRYPLSASCHPNCEEKNYSEVEEDNIKWRVNPLKQEAKLYYEGDWNADLAYNQEDANLEVKLHRSFKANASRIEIQHDSKNSETYLNYLLNW